MFERLKQLREGVVGHRDPALGAALHEPAPMLVLAAIGGPAQVAARLSRLRHALVALARYDAIRTRLQRCVDEGLIAGVPSRAQLVFGGIDMLRFLFEPGSARTDAERGISLPLHRLLRLLGDPVSMLDPGGVTAERAMVIEHLLSDFHYNPVYDLQLLRTFEGGLDALERACEQVLGGTHPDQARLTGRIPNLDYYRGLARYVRERRSNPRAPLPIHRDDGGGGNNAPRMGDEQRAAFEAAGAQLAELWGFLNYCHSLPTDPVRLARRLHTVRSFLQA